MPPLIALSIPLRFHCLAASGLLAIIHLLASRLRYADEPRTAMANMNATKRGAPDTAAYLATLR